MDFNAFATVVRTTLQPPARGEATAATLEELGAIGPAADIPQSAFAAAWALLGVSREGEPGNVMGRRATCRELAALAGEPGDARLAIPAWGEWAAWAHYAVEQAGLPRHAAMEVTFFREEAELISAIGEESA